VLVLFGSWFGAFFGRGTIVIRIWCVCGRETFGVVLFCGFRRFFLILFGIKPPVLTGFGSFLGSFRYIANGYSPVRFVFVFFLALLLPWHVSAVVCVLFDVIIAMAR